MGLYLEFHEPLYNNIRQDEISFMKDTDIDLPRLMARTS